MWTQGNHQDPYEREAEWSESERSSVKEEDVMTEEQKLEIW